MNKAQYSLFLAPTSYLTLGNSAYRLAYMQSVGDMRPTISKAVQITDEFGDKFIDVVIVYPAETIPLLSLYFCKDKNDHGFEYWSTIGTGFKRFFSDSWVWSPRLEKFVSFDDLESTTDNSLFLLSEMRDKKFEPRDVVEVVIHRPHAELSRSFQKNLSGEDSTWRMTPRLHLLEPIDRLQAVLDLAAKCEFVSAWMHGPHRPVLISRKGGQLLENIAAFCEKDNVQLVRVESESKWPSW